VGVGAFVIIAVGEIIGKASEVGAGTFVGVMLKMSDGCSALLFLETVDCTKTSTDINNAIASPSSVRLIAVLFLLFLFIVNSFYRFTLHGSLSEINI